MSSGAEGTAARSRVSIPSSVKNTIDDIKEITGKNHSEDEIYAMLQECSMDPNETVQKLLLLDTFHEVKKKRDKRKEILYKEPPEARWKTSSQWRQYRTGHGNHSSRPISRDAGGGRNLSAVKGSAISHISEKVSRAPLADAQEIKKSEASSVASSIADVPTCPSGITSQNPNSVHDHYVLTSGSASKFNGTENTSMGKLEAQLPFSSPIASNRNPDALEIRDRQQKEMNAANPTQRKSASAVQTTATVGISSVSRPSSSYNCRSEMVVTQKAGPGKEWKPKSTNPCISQATSPGASSEVSTISVGSKSESQQTSPKEATLELQRKLQELHISDTQNVIIPSHLHAPEPGKHGFCFGSFEASFGLEMTNDGGLGSEKNQLSESSHAIDKPMKELHNRTVLVAAEDTKTDNHEDTQSPSQGPEDLSTNEVQVLSSVTLDHGESKLEVAPQGQENPAADTSSSYNQGYVPLTSSGQLTPFESSESQACDMPRLSGSVQSFEPTSYYAQFFRPGMDSGGSISPIFSAGAANKYNGNAALVSAQTSQAPQESQGGSTASPVHLTTQAAGVMQTSIAATQQHLPVFHQPTGFHLPHYPPFIPYGPYFAPIYVPSPAIHQFLSNGAYAQQAQGGSLHPNPPGATAKYSVSQYKQGSNTGSSTHIAVPYSFGPYGPPLANYTNSSVTTSNEEVKENNIYAGAQKSEGSGVWHGQLPFAPIQPGQGTFTGIFHPAQAVTSVHPLLQQSQTITIPIDMLGPTGGVYEQQQQHAQLNWPSD